MMLPEVKSVSRSGAESRWIRDVTQIFRPFAFTAAPRSGRYSVRSDGWGRHDRGSHLGNLANSQPLNPPESWVTRTPSASATTAGVNVIPSPACRPPPASMSTAAERSGAVKLDLCDTLNFEPHGMRLSCPAIPARDSAKSHINKKLAGLCGRESGSKGHGASTGILNRPRVRNRQQAGRAGELHLGLRHAPLGKESPGRDGPDSAARARMTEVAAGVSIS